MTTTTTRTPLPDLIDGIRLTPAERAILEALDTGEFTTPAVLAAATNKGPAATSNVHQVLICRIRKKLKDANSPLVIVSRRGRGYVLTREGGAA